MINRKAFSEQGKNDRNYIFLVLSFIKDKMMIVELIF